MTRARDACSAAACRRRLVPAHGQDLFGLGHLGYAESPNPGSFGSDVLGAAGA